MTRRRWTTRFTRNLADELRGLGHQVSHHSVARLLAAELGYSLQGNAKTVEGKQHPDRDGQFRYISGQVSAHLSGRRAGDQRETPRRRSWSAPYAANKGRAWRPRGDPESG